MTLKFQKHVYKDQLRVFEIQAETPLAAAVFIHGGGWVGGDPLQFEDLFLHLVRNNVSSLSIEYRTAWKHRSLVADSVQDILDATPTIRRLTMSLPLFIIGASAGGLLAIHLTESIKTVAGVILLNPVLDLSATGFRSVAVPEGGDEAISPLHLPVASLPPTILFHAEGDEVVPIETSRIYGERLNAAGVSFKLFETPQAGHGYFHLPKYKAAVLSEIISFCKER